ncbi:DivIVA domain-containing protein [Bombilactobacillus folatiphilus]|uniref:DivIVA domain-containing protein n=1 Tax=Bombilactobacillus folatiphilus TaxID=2923362 RepID=A0ABY4PAS9_9LACO|nr:DivIVA domain-containing protein [Bombilactobacillus folatiphilus]UQS82710.1 DivIVA domain-containing protein [Bombilactobacillus folatiphilus]
MDLTPNDIKIKEFKSQLRGYDKNEVNQFLDKIIENYSDEIKTNHKLDHELKDAKAQIAYFNELQNTVNESIITAQNAADQVKKTADAQAQEVMAQARHNTENMVDQAIDQGRQIINDAQSKAQALIQKANELQTQIQKNYDDLQNIMAEQQSLLTSDTWRDLLTKNDQQLTKSIQADTQNYLDKLDQFAAEIKNNSTDEEQDTDDLVSANLGTQVVDKDVQNVDNQ